MSQKNLSNWLKATILIVGLCGLALYCVIVPSFGVSVAAANPEFDYCFVPWLVFISVTALPCYAALVLIWLMAMDIGRDRSFTTVNAKRLKWCAVLAAVDAAYFFIGNVVLLLANCSHPGITLMSMLVVFVAAAASVVFAALSHLVRKAAALQEQSDLTI